MMQYTITTKIGQKINGWVGRESRTRSSWRRARGEPRLIDPWRGGLVNVTQSNGSASLKCQLYPDKPSRFILIRKRRKINCLILDVLSTRGNTKRIIQPITAVITPCGVIEQNCMEY